MLPHLLPLPCPSAPLLITFPREEEGSRTEWDTWERRSEGAAWILKEERVLFFKSIFGGKGQ